MTINAHRRSLVISVGGENRLIQFTRSEWREVTDLFRRIGKHGDEKMAHILREDFGLETDWR